MKLRKNYRFAALALAMFCAFTNGHGVTLGRAHGAVYLGQPLKLSVPIQLESGEALSTLCFDADVYYGDTRQDANRIGINIEQLLQSVSVYVISRAVVDEPVVTVYLHAGCNYKSTRRFVLLADPAAETLSPIKRSAEVPASAPSGVAPSREAEVAKPFRDVTPAKKWSSARLDIESKIPVSSPVTPKANSIRRSQLKLLPIDMGEERDLVLKLSHELYLGEGENLQKRAEAAEAWRSLNSASQDVQFTDRRKYSMEADLKGLTVSTENNRKALQDLTDRLETAESQKYFNPLVYGLIATFLLSGFGVAFFVVRFRQRNLGTPQWWNAEAFSPDPSPLLVEKSGDAEPEEPGVGTAAFALSEVDIDLELDEPSGSGGPLTPKEGGSRLEFPLTNAQSRASGHADFAPSMTATLRSLNTQEMLDVRQQADFFMTLGQHDEALGMLKDCVEGSAESNPLVYLDLLRILHALGRKAEFDHYRSDFNALFSGHVPNYAAFNQAGEGLEFCPDICDTIDSLWPSEQAIEYIEKCLVRNSAIDTGPGMDLEAYRDLLMLHGVAKRMASSSDSGLLPFITPRASSAESSADYHHESNDLRAPPRVHSKLVDGVNIENISENPQATATTDNLIDFDVSEFSLSKRGQV
jgi:hypothetical protein